MKARTKLQLRVTELSLELPTITQEQEKWAFKECLPHKAFANKSSAFCLDCGETFSLDLINRKRATCPNCQTKLSVEFTKNRTLQVINYFAITHVVEDFQVVENFELVANYKKGIPVKRYLKPILEDWILPNLKVQKIGLMHNMQGFCDSWGGNWEVREEKKRSWQGAKYDVYPRKYHPDSKFKPEYRKYGINSNLSGITLFEAIKHVPTNPKLETLLKAKQYALLGQLESYRIGSFWQTIKICLRNKYIVQDAAIWFDYLDLLKFFKKDIRNAKFVCPKNIKKEHDLLMNKKREIHRNEERERERLNAIKRQESLEKAIVEYVQRNQHLFDLEFKQGNISIQILKSIDEFKEEGDELKHCVFTNEYYLKKDSLILSARVNGVRTETIEIKIPSLKIEQSRGYDNKPSKHNDKILALVRKNIYQIRKIVINSRQRSQKKAAA
jgi:hypothetical protein